MSIVAKPFFAVWDYFKIDNPEEFRDHYLDDTIDRCRKPKPEKKGKLAQLIDVFAWYPSHYSKYERQFLLKVDISVLIFTALSFYTKFLDSSNVSNAYVSGMKEELELNGNELNYFSSFFNFGYCIFQIPLILLIQKQSFARYLLIACEFCWGICTFGASTAHNAKQLYAVRFFVGVSEAVSFPGSYVIMSTWYTPEELVRRAGFYNLMASVGTATSGLLQSACREHLHNVLGKSGWRWQFIIDGVITMFCVLYGFLLFPGSPETTKKFGFFTEDDLVFARKRMRGKVALPTKFSKKVVKNIFFTWQPYVLLVLWVAHHQIRYESDLALYIKSKIEHYGPSAPTNFAAAAGGVGAVSAFLVPNLCAVYGRPWIVGIVFLISYFANINLIIWNIPEGLKLASYYLEVILQCGLAPTFYAWSANLCRDSAEKKQIVLALMNCLSYATQAWSIPLQWNTKYSPRFKMGFRVNIAMIVVLNLAFVTTWVLENYDYKIIPKLSGNRDQYEADTIASAKSTDNFSEVEEAQGSVSSVGAPELLDKKDPEALIDVKRYHSRQSS